MFRIPSWLRYKKVFAAGCVLSAVCACNADTLVNGTTTIFPNWNGPVNALNQPFNLDTLGLIVGLRVLQTPGTQIGTTQTNDPVPVDLSTPTPSSRFSSFYMPIVDNGVRETVEVVYLPGLNDSFPSLYSQLQRDMDMQHITFAPQDPAVDAVPEPSTFLLLGVGAALLAARARRRRLANQVK
ncbi:MAG TPA: PEP-CTERM sorting domain-containing protein [Bryobacteraceae bacterium]|jgi:hypothetical protein|nr:PEP-CTERM sorting domain-containing protein [Bryobacteraceae bacterium]